MFRDRAEGANKLVEKLLKYKNQNALVLAIPRGAVPMGEIIADKIDAGLDVVLVKKIGDFFNPEFAIGAVTEDGYIYPNPQAYALGYSKSFIQEAAKEPLETLHERRTMYGGMRKENDPRGRVVIIVDDGIATGSTVIAAINALKRQKPKKIVLAICVAPPETTRKLEKFCDELIVLITPSDFFAISQFFEEFPQVSDKEVGEILTRFHLKRREHLHERAISAH